jgi:hypothetical protein
MKKLVLSALVTATAFSVVFIGLKTITQTRVLSQNSSSGSLRERAKQAAGRYIGVEHPDRSVVHSDLATLAHQSTVVVVGTALENHCRLSADEEHITTDYQVRADEVLKGDVQPGSTITVSTPGGMKLFLDKTSAVIRVPEFRRPINGRTYLLFLSPSPSVDIFSLTAGPQGAFELPVSGKGVQPADLHSDDPVVVKYKDKSVKSFIREARRVAKNK